MSRSPCRPNVRPILPLLALLAIARAENPAGAVTIYDAAQGTFPEAQGWTFTETINPVMAYPRSVGPTGLHFSTLGFASNVPVDHGAGVYWSYGLPGLDFAQNFAIEFRLKIVSAPNHSTASGVGWPRPGYALHLTDLAGRTFWVGLGSGEIFLSNTVYGAYGTSNTVTTAFNTTDTYHVYRMERAAGGVGAALRVDGVQKLELTVLGPIEGPAQGFCYFGDGTYWANSESYTTTVTLITPTVDASPPLADGLLWTKVLRTPTERVRLAYRAGASGTLSFDLYDVAGRRVEHARREVTAGQAGTIEAMTSLENGIYFYRAELVTPSGGERAVSGGRALVLN